MSKTGILLTNIGTPLSNDPKDVGDYLSEFLMDPYVVDIPKVLRWILVKVLIVPRRKFASSEAYKKIWLPEGSPLLLNSLALVQNLAKSLGSEYSVKLGMRYSQPSIETAIREFSNEKISKLLVLPMYPQFADSSSTSSIEKVRDEIQKQKLSLELRTVDAFYDEKAFLDSYSEVIRENLKGKKVEHYLFSYHGLPQRQIQRLHPDFCFQNADCCAQVNDRNRNCYRAQCVATTKALAEKLDLKAKEFSFSFQSRLGRTKWIEPYTDLILPELAAKGVRNLAVVCPSFVADCLETLEEIGIRGRDQFMSAGGKSFHLIPCLNAHPVWSESLTGLLETALQK